MTESTKNHLHLYFVFQLRNHGKPVAFHYMSDTTEDALYGEDRNIQSLFETLQENCRNKLTFTIQSKLSPETKGSAVPGYEDMDIVDVIEDMVGILENELASNEYPDIEGNAICKKENHLMLGIYANLDVKYNVVGNKDVITNYLYNTTFRFGRLYYLDGIRMYDGCIKKEYLSKYDDRAASWTDEYKDRIRMSAPTTPYE